MIGAIKGSALMDKKHDNSHRESTGAVLEGLKMQSYCTGPHREKNEYMIHIKISKSVHPEFCWEIHEWRTLTSYIPSERIYCN